MLRKGNTYGQNEIKTERVSSFSRMPEYRRFLLTDWNLYNTVSQLLRIEICKIVLHSIITDLLYYFFLAFRKFLRVC